MSTSLRHSAIFIAAYIATLLLNYAFGILLSWYLSTEQFGVLGVAHSLLLLIALVVGSGFAWTATHEIASQGITEASRRVFRASFLLNTVLGLLIGGSLVGAYALGLLPLGPSYTLVIPLIGATTVLLASRAVINGAGRGSFQFTPVAINLVIEVAVKVLCGIFLVWAGFGVAGVLAGFAIGALVSLIHSVWLVREARLWSLRGWLLKDIFPRTIPLFVGMLSTALMLNLDVLGLKLFTGPFRSDTLVGYYQAVVILSRSPVFIAQAISLVTFSYASLSYNPSGVVGADTSLNFDSKAISGYLLRGLRAWIRMLLPVGVLLVIAPQAALMAFFPPEYRVTAPILQICAAGAVLLALVTLWNSVLQTTTARRNASLATAAGILIQLILLAMLVPRFGIWGPAISLLAGSTVALAFLLPIVLMELKPANRIFSMPSFRGFELLPWIAMTLPLLVLPDTSQSIAVIQIFLAGVCYSLTLFLVSVPLSFNKKITPSNRLSLFVKELMGG